MRDEVHSHGHRCPTALTVASRRKARSISKFTTKMEIVFDFAEIKIK
jgi:hypothetical protein